MPEAANRGLNTASQPSTAAASRRSLKRTVGPRCHLLRLLPRVVSVQDQRGDVDVGEDRLLNGHRK